MEASRRTGRSGGPLPSRGKKGPPSDLEKGSFHRSGSGAADDRCRVLPNSPVCTEGKDDRPAQQDRKETVAVAFLDNSVSSRGRERVLNVWKDSLDAVLKESLSDPKGHPRVFALNEKTSSKAYQASFRNEAQRAEKSLQPEQAMAQVRYQRKVREQIQTGRKKMEKFIGRLEEMERHVKWTNIWGSIEVVKEQISASGLKGGKNVGTIYYFSDMFESMAGPSRRDFDSSPPSSRAEARKWAKEYLERMRKRYKVSDSLLSGTDVKMLPAYLATRDAGEEVKAYWKTVFQGLGAETVTYND